MNFIKNTGLFEKAILMMVFLYPLAIIATPLSMGAAALISLIGIGFLIKSPPTLIPLEKTWLYSVYLLSAYVALTMLWTENNNNTLRELGSIFRLFLIFPLYFLLKKYSTYLPQAFLLLIIVAGPLLLLVQNEARGSDYKNYMHYGFISATITFFALTLLIYVQPKNYWLKALLLVSFLCAFFVTLKTGARGALVGLFISFLFLVIVMLRDKHYKTLLFFFTGVILATTIIFTWGASNSTLNRYLQTTKNISTFIQQANKTHDNESHSSSAYRLKQWEVSYRLWLQKPFFGYGIGNFSITYKNYIDTHEIKVLGDGDNSRDPHSNYFLLLVGIGLIGLILVLISWFILPAMLALRHSTKEYAHVYSYMALGLILLFAGFGLTEAWMFRSLAGVYMFFLSVLLALLTSSDIKSSNA